MCRNGRGSFRAGSGRASLKDTANYVRDEVAKWGKIVRETGAKAE